MPAPALFVARCVERHPLLSECLMHPPEVVEQHRELATREADRDEIGQRLIGDPTIDDEVSRAPRRIQPIRE